MSIFKKTALIIGDIFILYLSLILTLIIRYGAGSLSESLPNHLFPFSLIFLLWLIIFYLADLYRQHVLRNANVLFQTLFIAILISGIISVIVFYLFGGFFELTPKTNLLIFGLIFFFLDFLFRNAIRKAFAAGALGTAIIGNSKLVNETISYLQENPQAGYRIVQKFNKFSPEVFETISNGVTNGAIQTIVIHPQEIALPATAPYDPSQTMNTRLLYQLLPEEVNIVNFWNFYEMIFEKAPLEELQESWFIENIATRRPFYDATKRLLDFLLAFTCGLILLPFTIIIAVLIKITSRGPIIFQQQRIGKNSRIITLYKFRTMYDKNRGPLWTEAGDKRVTFFGKFLRYTHLDEIPQFWNIIKGDISFIGPRPERIELAEKYRQFPHYEIRHVVKPGLTGWAQINYGASASLEEAKEKLCYDIYYVKNRSIFLDLMIVLKTIKYLLTSHG